MNVSVYRLTCEARICKATELVIARLLLSLALRDQKTHHWILVQIFYECDRCTDCCRWPGQVRLTDVEIGRMANFLSLTEYEFIQTHTRLTQDRQGLALTDKATGECVFLENGNCRVQPVKPQQCRDFRNLWNFPAFRSHCQAKAHVVSEPEYRLRVSQGTGRSPQSISLPHPDSSTVLDIPMLEFGS